MLDTKTTNGHSLISPSRASRWSACPASVRLGMAYKDTTNHMAQRGTDIHQLGEMLLKGEKIVEGRSVIRDYDKKSMFYANRAMLGEARAYAQYVRSLMTEPDAELIAEAKVDIIPQYDLSGHIDATVINGNTLHIIDLKTGRGAVKAEENLQMQLYALGTLDEHEMFYDFDKVVLHIVQDNAMIHNTNSWETTPEDLEDFREWITERARLALQEDSECKPSNSACQWCPHAPKCDALFKTASDALEFVDLDSEETVVGSSIMASMGEVLNFMKKRKLVELAFKAYESRITDEIKAGGEVAGYKIIKTAKRKVWVNETEAFDKLKTWEKLDEIAPRKLVTPTQAIKLFGKMSTRKVNVLNELFETPEGDLKLVNSNQKGEAVIFKQFEDLDS
jgi:hypothetical protein